VKPPFRYGLSFGRMKREGNRHLGKTFLEQTTLGRQGPGIRNSFLVVKRHPVLNHRKPLISNRGGGTHLNIDEIKKDNCSWSLAKEGWGKQT